MNLAQRTLVAVTLLLSAIWAGGLLVAATFRSPAPASRHAPMPWASAGEPTTRPSPWPVAIAAGPGLPTAAQVQARLAAVKPSVDEK